MNNRIYDKKIYEKHLIRLTFKLYCKNCDKILCVTATSEKCCENSKLVGINEMRNIKIDKILNGS